MTQQPTAPALAPIRQVSRSARRTSGSASGAVTACQADAARSGDMLMVVGGEDEPTAVGDLDDRAAVGRLEGAEVEDLGRRAERDLATVDAEHGVESVRLLEVVAGDDHPMALARQPREQRLQSGGARRVEAGERLV